MEIEELVVAAQSGDEKAYEEIVERFQKMAVSYAFSKLGNFEEAQDVAQEAFLKAYGDLLSLRDPKAFPAWFRTIVERQAFSVRRRSQALLVPLEEGEVPRIAPTQGRKLRRKEVRERVAESLARLPDHEAETVRLFYLEELPLTKVAERLGCSVGAVKTRLHSARSRLQQQVYRQAVATQSRKKDKRLTEMATREAVQAIDTKLQALVGSVQKGIGEASDLICAKGRLLRFLGEVPAAVDLYEGALGQVPFCHDPAIKARLRLERGLSRMAQGDYRGASEDFRHCQRSLAQDSRWRLLLELGLGMLAWRRGDLTAATRHNKTAVRRACDEKRVRGQQHALNNLSLISWRRGQLTEALDGFKESLSLARRAKDRYGQASVQMNMGSIKDVQGRFQEAKRLHQRARKLAEELEYWPLLGAIRCNLADVSLRQQRYDEALVHAMAAVELARQTSDRRSEAIALENSALAFAYLGQFGNAAQAVTGSEAIGTQLGDKEQLLSLELVKAEVLLPEEKYGGVLEVLSSANKMIEKQGSMVEMPRLLRIRAEAQLGLGLVDDARRTIRKGRRMCKQQGNGAEDRALARLERSMEK